MDIGLQNSNNQEEYEYTFATTFGSSPTANNRRPRSPMVTRGAGSSSKSADTWYLVGLIDGLSPCRWAAGRATIRTTSSGGELYGSEIMADLAPYESTIAAMVPEPSGFVLGILGAGLAVLGGLCGPPQPASPVLGLVRR